LHSLKKIDQIDAIRALSDPRRIEILQRLMVHPETISSLGAALDKHPAWVRYHVRALEEAGLVSIIEERVTRNYTEKFYSASAPAYIVGMLIRPELAGARPLVALASSDFAVELLADEVAKTSGLITGVAGSLDSLIALRQGLADIAGCHLLDVDTGQYNVPYARHLFPDRDIMIVTLAHREQGLIVPSGNPLSLSDIDQVTEGRLRFVNRNPGSGTRLWLDHTLRKKGLTAEEIARLGPEVNTHAEAASLVASGEADVALGVHAAAEKFDLGFIPLFSERYDLVLTKDVYDTEEASRVIDSLHRKSFRKAISKMAGYDSTETGDEYRLVV